jgi:hypothetical protein
MSIREKLEAAWREANPTPLDPKSPEREVWFRTLVHFTRLLDAEAWLEAAMMLYEPGQELMLSWSRMSVDMGGNNWKASVDKHRASAPTPAEALLAAIEKART